TAFLVSLVRDPEGRAQQCPYPAPTCAWLDSVARDRTVRVERATWLGLLLRLDAMRRYGLPVTEFFIWHEDQELTERLTRHMAGWCVPESVIVHYQDSVFDPFRHGDKLKFLHGIRNRIAWIKLSAAPFPLKLFRIIKFTVTTLARVVTCKIPASAVLWLVKGYLFRPQVRMLEY
ncbi:MAG: hypothetical protein U9Q79_01655, partial [Candidatus Hydrogenedentes bacterium]|nr:hypothetical protein [Candidatus Hydrogenedentota bacterium]